MVGCATGNKGNISVKAPEPMAVGAGGDEDCDGNGRRLLGEREEIKVLWYLYTRTEIFHSPSSHLSLLSLQVYQVIKSSLH